jgi:hypothetical protein
MIRHRSTWNRLCPIGLTFFLAAFRTHLCAQELSSPTTLAAAAATTAQRPSVPKYTLHASASWQLNAPKGERFDASALLFLPDGSLLTLNDRSHILHRIRFSKEPGNADLIPEPNLFSTNGMYSAEVPPPRNHDVEGLSRDSQGRIYMCEESRRRILRFDPATKKGEVLDIDWTPVRKYFDSKDSNASFEGVAVGGDTLYVANERNVGRIIAIDLKTLKIKEHFQVSPADRPARDVHYSDLSWFADQLWVLCRESHCVLRVDPKSHKVLGEYDYSNLELSHATAYLNPYPGYGFMEGLAVDATNIWLAIDNNGFPRIADPKDTRPSVYRCARPDSE